MKFYQTEIFRTTTLLIIAIFVSIALTSGYYTKQNQALKDTMIVKLNEFILKDSLSESKQKEFNLKIREYEDRLYQADLKLKYTIDLINSQSKQKNKVQVYQALGIKDSSDCPDSNFWRENNIALTKKKDCEEKSIIKDSIISLQKLSLLNYIARLNDCKQLLFENIIIKDSPVFSLAFMPYISYYHDIETFSPDRWNKGKFKIGIEGKLGIKKFNLIGVINNREIELKTGINF